MGFEVFIYHFTNGEPAGFPVPAIREAFGPHLEVMDAKSWEAVYDDNHQTTIHLASLPSDSESITSITVDRPHSDLRLWEAMFSILKLGNFVLFYPAIKPPLLVADLSVVKHLPVGMVETMGRVICIKCGQDICDTIRNE
jgi:hypothetical protein